MYMQPMDYYFVICSISVIATTISDIIKLIQNPAALQLAR